MVKEITIVNGSASSSIVNGDYTVSASVNGYDNDSINPDSVSVVSGTNEYQFTISADGTLTIHVSEDGTSTGVDVVGATFQRTDSQGNLYGNVITSDASGNAVFDYVPYDTTNAPTIYIKQLSSDGDHEFSTDLITVNMTTDTYTYELENPLGATRTITLTDENYENLPIESATLTLTN